MIRKEFRSFELLCDDLKYSCQAPCSVYSVLSSAKADLSVAHSRVAFETEIMIDESALAMNNIYLFIRGIRGIADVFVGNKLVLTTDDKTPTYTLDIRESLHVGSNILSVRFDANNEDDLVYSGIGSAFEIVHFDNTIIENLALEQTHTGEGVHIDVKLDLLGDADNVRAIATLVSPTGQIYYAGLTKGRGSILVKDPLYWWPKGLGVQNIYRLTVNLYGESSIEDSFEVRMGLRTVCLDRNENSSLLSINGVKFLPMGATYSTEEYSDLTTLAKKAETFVTAASKAGFNCLVIPADSARPCERFYELCDLHGILIIEEHNKLDEATLLNLDRNRHHASFGIVDIIGESIERDDLRNFERRLPALAYKLMDSSPKYVNSPALPSMKTLGETIPKEECSLFSKPIEDIAEPGAIKNMLMAVADRYPYPSDLSKFAYASALSAVNAVGESIRQSRMSMGESGRAVFNRLCDFSMTISPSAIDCKDRWKPLQYYSSRHFAPLAVYADAAEGRVVFSTSNLRRHDFIGTLEYRIADASNYTIYKASEEIEVSAHSARKLFTRDLSEYINGHEQEYYLEYYLKESSSAISKKTLLFVPEKHFAFKKPKLKTVITGKEKSFSVTISSDVFVKDLEIDFEGIDVALSDNYIDLTSEAPVKISFEVLRGVESSYHLKDIFRTRSVVDLK